MKIPLNVADQNSYHGDFGLVHMFILHCSRIKSFLVAGCSLCVTQLGIEERGAETQRKMFKSRARAMPLRWTLLITS